MNERQNCREGPQPHWEPVFIVLHTLFYVSVLKKKILREDIKNKEELLKFGVKMLRAIVNLHWFFN